MKSDEEKERKNVLPPSLLASSSGMFVRVHQCCSCLIIRLFGACNELVFEIAMILVFYID